MMSHFFDAGQGVSSYVPELTFLETKNARGCRICHEDVAVLDARRDLRLVSYRGVMPLPDGDYLSLVGVPSEDRSFLLSHLGMHPHMLLSSSSGPLLVFGDLLPETGLLLLVRLHPPKGSKRPVSVSSLMRALSLIERADFVPSPSVASVSVRSRSGDMELCSRLEEILYYTEALSLDRLLPSDLASSALRLASFAGCDPRRIRFLDPLPELPSRQAASLLTFLLCSFLALRQQNGELLMRSEEDGDRELCCLVRFRDFSLFSLEPSEEERSVPSSLSYLDCACFEGATQSWSEGGLLLEARMPVSSPEPHTVGAPSDGVLLLSMLFFAA